MSPHEPVLPGMGDTGSGASGAGVPDPRLAGVAALVRRAIGTEPLALLAGGSHATGEAVWADDGGRPRALSDLDAWWVAPDDTARAAAIAAWRSASAAVAADARALGFDAPIELSVVTPAGLARLPAKPGVLELRAGIALLGDPAWLGRVPSWRAAEVDAEEALLLLENRGFELLAAHPARASGGRFERLAARHAVLKACADLAVVLDLETGQLPAGTAARVLAARARLDRDPSLARLRATGVAALWDAVVAWRAGRVEEAADGPAAEWARACAAWVETWRHIGAAVMLVDGESAPALATALAARAPFRRRVRLALRPAEGTRPAPLTERLRFAAAGTPQHRLNAAAAAVLACAPGAETGLPRLEPETARLLARLGFGRISGSWETARAGLVARWRAWVLGRPEGAP